MPFTLPLREVPSFPTAHSKITNANDTPATEFTTFLSELRAYLDREYAALVQLEPPAAMESKTVAQLPAAASSTGKSYMVTDANATTFNSIVAGGGANIVRVFSNGTTWRIG